MISCCLLRYSQQHPDPPPIDSVIYSSPTQDYFALPRLSVAESGAMTPLRRPLQRGSLTPMSPGGPVRVGTYSSILNTSSASLRSGPSPGLRRSIDLTPKTPLETTFEDAKIPGSIPVPLTKTGSPRPRERVKSNAGQASASPPSMTPIRSAGKSSGSRLSDERRRESGVTQPSYIGSSHGSVKNLAVGSPLKQRGRAAMSEAGSGSIKRNKVCGVKVELLPEYE